MPSLSGRRALAAIILLALLALAVVWLITRGDGGDTDPDPPPTPTETVAGTTTGEVEADVPAELAAVPEWGDFDGAPPPLEPPSGGGVEVTETPEGERDVQITRADGSRYADLTIAPNGEPVGARYFDESGALELVVTSVRARPGPKRRPASGSAALRVRCGSSARTNAGWRIAAFPFRWKLHIGSMPVRLRREGGLRALRAAHGVWNANRSHCRGLPDRSRLRFLYTGTTRRPVGLNGVNSVGFGDTGRLGGVCAGSVACTLTWLRSGNRVRESDTRFHKAIRGGFSTRRRPTAFDLQSVMVHEAGHTIGIGHVSSASNVMYRFAKRGDVTARRLGRGDALINNSKY